MFATVASYGIQLCSPYYKKTIGNWQHSELQDYLTKTYAVLKNHDIYESFFDFNTPHFSDLGDAFFQRIQQEHYFGEEVVGAIKAVFSEHSEDCLRLANKLRPILAETLSRQRGKAYGFGDHQDEDLYVFNQAPNVDRAPTNTLPMERQCGDQDHRLTKKRNLSATSRGNVLKLTTSMRDQHNDPNAFRTYGPIVRIIDNIELQWSDRQDVLRREGLKKREQQSMRLETSKMKTLQRLRARGGPFISSEEVMSFMTTSTDTSVDKQTRLSDEVKFQRDSSKSLPRTHNFFRMIKVDKLTKSRNRLTTSELADNLMKYLNMSSAKPSATFEKFTEALSAIA